MTNPWCQIQLYIHAQQQAVNSFNISVNIPDSSNMIISKKHALKTFIYFICMICCCLPFLSYSLLRTTSVIGYEANWTFTETVVFLNSPVNPFLYCSCYREIRTSAVKVVRRMMCKQTEVQLASLRVKLVFVTRPFHANLLELCLNFVSVKICVLSEVLHFT